MTGRVAKVACFSGRPFQSVVRSEFITRHVFRSQGQFRKTPQCGTSTQTVVENREKRNKLIYQTPAEQTLSCLLREFGYRERRIWRGCGRVGGLRKG